MNSIIPGANYQGIISQSTTLKRTRSIESEGRHFNASLAPPLPQIHGDLILQVFTHKSLRRPHVPPAEYGDNERLVVLGERAFDLAITHFLFRRRPMLPAAYISKQLEILLSKPLFYDWVAFYGLLRRLRCHPDVVHSLNSPKETSSIFYAYVGGLFMTSGQDAVNHWIERLLSQERIEIPESDPTAVVTIPPQKRPKSETMSPVLKPSQGPPIFFASQPPPSPPVRHMPLHLTVPPPIPPNPLAPAQPNMPFLPLFNQAAMQRRVTVEYIAQFSGPQHAPRWTVNCIVNGICKGVGSSNHKQIAKEEAARKAYYSMGWT